MKKHLFGVAAVFICVLVCAGPSDIPANGSDKTKADQAATELGYKVQAIMHAIENPKEPGAMHAVTSLGHDQRHYVMVRGWLAYQLQGDLSIRAANKDQTPDPVNTRIEFLQKAIRALDLE